MNDAEAVSENLLTWLKEEGLPVESSADGSVLEITIPESDDRKLRVIVLPDASFLLFSMTARATVPRARWTALYPLLSDVNSRIGLGAWVLDPSTEVLVYRLAIPAVGAAYEAEALRAVLRQVVATVGAMEKAFAGVTEDGVLAAWADEEDPEE